MRCGPCIERSVRINRNVDESFEAVAKRPQVHTRAKAFNHLRLFHAPDTLGHGRRRQVNLAPDFRVTKTAIALQKSQDLAVIGV